jgi:capsular exopolysaccharide synthesis family protein
MTTRSVSTDAVTTLLTRVRRRWGVFVGVFLVTATLVMAVKYVLVPRYTATSAVLIEPDRSPIDKRENSADYSNADATEVESQVEIIRSPRLFQAMLRQPAVQAALLRACDYNRSHSSVGFLDSYVEGARRSFGLRASDQQCVFDDSSAAVEAVGKKFTIYQVGRSRVVSVNFQSPLPDTAALVVNALVSEYLADNVKAKSNARMTTAKWLEDEGLKLRQSLLGKEAQIDTYRREHGLLRGQQGLITQESLSNLVAQLDAAKARLANATARYDEMHAAAQHNDAAAAPAVVGAGTVRDLRTMEAGLARDSASVAAQYGEHHPKAVAARNQLNDVRAALSAEVGRISKSLAAEVTSARSDEQALQTALDKTKGEATSAADADSQVQSLVRDADIDRQLYLVFASRAKELETETRAQSPNAQLVSLAEVPERPSFPQLVPFAGVALLLGMVCGGGAAFARDSADKTLRNIDDFVNDVDVPVLARIPVERGLTRRANFIATVTDNRRLFREAIRALYAHLQLKADIRTLLVTSSAPREGKTSVSVALAHFAAAAGQRVLLIEADLRMPVFAQIMPLNGDGLEAYIRAPSPEALSIEVPFSHIPNFHVLPAGDPAQDSTELLSSPRMAALLRSARASYDLVVVDTPPANYLMDACMLARWTDGVIFVARWGQSEPDLMREAMRTIKLAGGKIIGTVIGMVEYRSYSMYGNSKLISKNRYVSSR